MQKINLFVKKLSFKEITTWSSWVRVKRCLQQNTRSKQSHLVSLDDKTPLVTNTTVDLIHKNIIFENDALIAVNKPAGLSVYGTEHCAHSGNNVHSIQHCLPLLSNRLKCPDLEIGLSLKSYFQGVMLFCKNREYKEKLDKCMTQMIPKKSQFLSVLAVTIGVPTCPHNILVDICLKREYIHNREMSTVTNESSNTLRKKGLMILTNFTVKPLLVNTLLNVALMEISINKDKWDALETLMSHYLSPVLGDEIYSSRVYTLRGTPFASSPYTSKPRPQELPAGVICALKDAGHLLQKNQLPLFLHRHKVTLNKFPTFQSSPLVIKFVTKFILKLHCTFKKTLLLLKRYK
ncbi:hypothetical protein Btru_062038 [Bulinus truncatus]|nr:hypothetical protein Btru_062038 [Bulinus truncatus]